MKRSNSQMRHKSSETKPRQREAGPEYFETIDSGWTSRDSSSMDRWGSHLITSNKLSYSDLFI